MKTFFQYCGVFLVLSCAVTRAGASRFTVTALAIVNGDNDRHKHEGNSGVVVWLEPIDATVMDEPSPKGYRLQQKDRVFEPHVLVVPVGAKVNFPNHDMLFHNVFSMFNGKRFDLGLYEAGTSKAFSFDRPGISYIFCNIHDSMSAVVIALRTPYYGISNREGKITIPGVPAGRYRLNVWAEGAGDDATPGLSREVTIQANTNLETLAVRVSSSVNVTHLNKYGLAYDSAVDHSSY
jgi:plastocyanin